MANVFWVEWTEKGKAVRQKVEFGNFDGDVEKAQNEIDKLWPFTYPQRSNVTVKEIVGAGEVKRVTIPGEAPARTRAAEKP